MDLRTISNQISTTINANIPVIVRKSAGYTKDPNTLKQIPAYAPDVSGFGQLQALDMKDLQQLDGLNIQGTIKALYLRGVLAGVIRPDSKGGDIVVIAGRTWLTVKVLEGWSDWTKIAIVLQGD